MRRICSLAQARPVLRSWYHPKDKTRNSSILRGRQFFGQERSHWSVCQTMKGQSRRRQRIYRVEGGSGSFRRPQQQNLQRHNPLQFLRLNKRSSIREGNIPSAYMLGISAVSPPMRAQPAWRQPSLTPLITCVASATCNLPQL